jgi:hypothetical protein
MHNVISAVSRRKAGLAASVVLVGGMAGGVLFTSGTAFAAVSTSTSIGSVGQTLHSDGSTTLNVPVTVSPAGGNVAPGGTVTVYDGSESCGINLAQIGSSANSGGSCYLGGLSAGSYTLKAVYSGSPTAGFSGSSGTAGVNIGSGPAFTADHPSTSANNGDNYSYNFNASGNPAPSYSLSGAPGWLSINTSDGVVSGKVPNGINSFTYSVVASNNIGTATAGPFTVQVSHHGFPGGNGNGRLATSLSCSTPVRSGARGTCTLDVTNTGSGNAQNVSGDISLPSQLTADFCGHGWGLGWFNNWGCSISGNTASENLGTLRPGQSRSVTVTFTARSTYWLWGHGRQFREWVRVDGSAQSQGSWQSWNWFGGSSSYTHTYVQILPPRFWW